MPVLTLELSTNPLNLPRLSPGAFPIFLSLPHFPLRWHVPIEKRRKGMKTVFQACMERAHSHTSLAGTSSVCAAARVSAFNSDLIQVQIPYFRLVP